MVEVADLKAKIEIKNDNALAVLEKLGKRLDNIADSILEMDVRMQEMAKRGAESMGFLGHSMSFAFGGIIKDSVKLVVNRLKDAWNSAQELAQNLDRLQFNTGIDTLGLQRMKAVLEQNNISLEDFLGSYSRVQDMMARMKYNQLSKDELMAFGRLGINPAEYRTAESLLKAIGNGLNRISKIEDRNFLASKLKITTETLRGLQAEGWYDEFAALTDKEKDKMLGYARNSISLGQEISATWTKFVSKFIAGDGVQLQEWALDTLGEFNKLVSESDSFGEALERLGKKISSVFDIKVEDTKFVQGLKVVSQTLWGALTDGVKDMFYEPAKAFGAGLAYLTNKNVQWRDVVGTVNPVSNSYGGNTTNYITDSRSYVITTTGDNLSEVKSVVSDPINKMSILMTDTGN